MSSNLHPMIPIKIQCECGQKYAFDVEPVGGRLPTAVACPICGTDGTEMANAFIARYADRPEIALRSGTTTLRVALPTESAPAAATVAARRPLLPGQIDPEQAVVEARAKISWGDAPQEVVKFLMLQGFKYQEANELIEEMFAERVATIRGNGIKKMVIGAFLMCVPVAAWFGFQAIGYLSIKLFAITVMAGLYGLWNVLKGFFMLISPKSEAGDVAEQ
jgi:hypothetical protein